MISNTLLLSKLKRWLWETPFVPTCFSQIYIYAPLLLNFNAPQTSSLQITESSQSTRFLFHFCFIFYFHNLLLTTKAASIVHSSTLRISPSSSKTIISKPKFWYSFSRFRFKASFFFLLSILNKSEIVPRFCSNWARISHDLCYILIFYKKLYRSFMVIFLIYKLFDDLYYM